MKGSIGQSGNQPQGQANATVGVSAVERAGKTWDAAGNLSRAKAGKTQAGECGSSRRRGVVRVGQVKVGEKVRLVAVQAPVRCNLFHNACSPQRTRTRIRRPRENGDDGGKEYLCVFSTVFDCGGASRGWLRPTCRELASSQASVRHQQALQITRAGCTSRLTLGQHYQSYLSSPKYLANTRFKSR